MLISVLSSYVLPFRSSDEKSRPKDLKPKKLFTTDTLWDNEEDEDDDLFYPEYEPPYEKQINSLKTDLELNPLSAVLTYPGTSYHIPMDRACSQEYGRKIGIKIRQLLREIFQKM